MRCFISIDLPENARKEISMIQQELPKDAIYTMVEPGKTHLTMKFLGEIPDEKAGAVKELLSKINFPKFKARLNELSVFTPNFIKVVYINVEPKSEFEKMHAIIEKLLSLEDFKPDERWECHATIARVKSVRDKRRFMDEIQKIKIQPVEFNVDNITFKKSTLTENGPVYEDLLVLKLK